MPKKILRYSYIGIIVCFMSFVNPSIVLADEEVLRISLKDAIAMAIEASEDVQIQDNEIFRQNSKLRKERAEIYPHISTLTKWSSNYHYPNIASTASTRHYSFDAGITVDQTIYKFGRISSAISEARKQIEISQWNRETTKQEFIYIAKLAYYNAYLAKRTFEIAQESHKQAQENKTILESRSASGRVSKYDNIKIAADIASRIPTVNNARASLNSALQTLKTIIGIDAEKNIDIIDSFTAAYQTFNRENLIKELFEKQPELKALEKTIAATEDTVQEKRAEYFPEISAFSTWNNKGSGSEYDIGSDNLYNYGVAGLEVSLPIWEGGERKEELQQAKIDKKNAELNLQKRTKDLFLEFDIAIGEYHEFIKTLEANIEAVRLAKESFKMSQDLFRSGQISVADLNDAELLLTRGKLNKEIALFNINTTLAKIEKLTLTGINNE